MRIVVCLFDEGKFLSLGLIETTFDRVRLLQLLQRQNEQFGVVLVRERSAGDKLYSGDQRFEEMTHGKGIGANFLLSSQWTVAV